MYIPYEEICNNIARFLPETLAKSVVEFGYNKKIAQNLCYIQKNKIEVLKRLKNKIKREKLNVAFYNYDETKWKAQSLFDLFLKSDKFYPYIVATKNYSDNKNMNYQTQEDVDRVFDFFKNKNMDVLKGFKNNKFIAFNELEIVPDIIIYCHPWYIYKTQGPTITSKYALSGYIPYCLPTSISPIEYYTRFHQYIENFYVLDDLIKDYYSKNMSNKGSNIKAFGHTMLDYFYLNKDKNFEQKGYVIYAPHWSIDEDNNLHWGTFLDLGDKILEFAKNHPEINWIYRPHPCFESYLEKYRIREDILNYRHEWEKIGKYDVSGDYLKTFMESKAIITDCGSFQTEYFITQKPFIYLKSKNPTPFNPFVDRINKTYYKVENADELYRTLKDVILDNNDYKKPERKKLYDELGLENKYAAKNIYDDFIKMLT